LIASFSALAQESNYSFKESFKVKEPFNLKIESNNSNIEVVGHDTNEVVVFYTITKKLENKSIKITKQELANLTKGHWKLAIQNKSNSLEIKVVNTRKDGFTKLEDQIDVHFKVYTPKNTNTQLISNDGNIKVTGLALNQKCITNDGDIYLTNLKGKIYANTMDGEILLSKVTGDLETIVDDGKVVYLSDSNGQ
jgi:hypothetical protein